MSTRTCAYCIFARPAEGENEGKVECHYNPPAVTGWPILKYNDWCGRWSNPAMTQK